MHLISSGVTSILKILFEAAEEHFTDVGKATQKTKEASEVAKTTMDTLNLTTADTIHIFHTIQKDINKLVGRFHEILGIIGMIDDIREQTNLLALNSAIEAAIMQILQQ
ncbi:MAG TPA: methyl-accepting chemotaxis protein [Mobilitalea sp.]|nr:methyl-accepting chemotaxis protein [Mobilitalea sp.]